MEEYFQVFEDRKQFFRTQNILNTAGKTVRFDYIKIKIFCLSKDTINGAKRQATYVRR